MEADDLRGRPAILIAEKRDPFSEDLQTLLESRGYFVLRATDGKEALDILTRVKPEMVLADLELPHIDGCSLLAEIRGDATLKGVPFVLLSAGYQQESIRLCQELGMDGRFDTTGPLGELLETVDRVLSGSSRDSTHPSAQIRPTE